jgi:predicted Zn-dependent protease
MTLPVPGRVGRMFLVTVAIAAASCTREKTLYLVPIGRLTAVSIDEVGSHYRDRFGIDVVTLPLLTLDRTSYDPQRDQLIAEELVAQLKRGYPEHARNPRAVIIALTDGDIYIRSSDWQFAFSYREDGRFGVLSAARMNPARFHEPPDDELLRRRFRKMLTKSVGILFFGLETNDDPKSVLYGNVLGLEELDGMGEDLPEPSTAAPR